VKSYDANKLTSVASLFVPSQDEVVEDEEFMRTYRDQRLKQLKYANTYPTYGTLREVDPFEYSELVDSMDPRCCLVVHMYEPYVEGCKRINGMLDTLAKRMTWCQFVRLHCFKANPNFDPIALPVIMIHRGGDLVNNFVKVTDDLPKEFKAEDLQWLLENAGVVNPESVEGRGNFVVAEVENETEVTGKNTHGVTVTHVDRVDGGQDSDEDDLDTFLEDFEEAMGFPDSGGQSVFGL